MQVKCGPFPEILNKIRTDEFDYLRCYQGTRENRVRNETWEEMDVTSSATKET
jgi:hypothetical protein